MAITDHNQHFTLKENTLKRADLDDFVNCYFGGKRGETELAVVDPLRRGGLEKRGDTAPRLQGNRHDRKESVRFKSFTYEELIKRDKINLDIFWLKDEALEDSANLLGLEIQVARFP